jgi:hypothetical protein
MIFLFYKSEFSWSLYFRNILRVSNYLIHLWNRTLMMMKYMKKRVRIPPPRLGIFPRSISDNICSAILKTKVSPGIPVQNLMRGCMVL